ncbi:uncharacterized protein LOC123500836 [Portunus trituberculatus]|uniref:uncharacterized protein LOC123500836 n=1 Tax=Portunus trituberculatus TaxID=210409 RepID=UPI001E1CF142|nr:uncharacterized protein LOC123500836 [Portunus trituberculatus]
MTNEDLRTEIEEKNNIKIDDIHTIPKVHMIKIRLQSRQQAKHTKDTGIKLFSQIIPSYNINIEEYRPVTQCYKCYQFTHRTNQCKETDITCSKCATIGHDHRNCQATTLKCINCSGEHTAVSFRCPNKRTAQQHQNSKTPAATTQNTTYAQAATSVTPSPNTTTTSNNTEKQSLLDVIIKMSIQLSFGNLEKQTELLNSLLTSNGYPTVKFPANFIQNNEKQYQQSYTENQQTTQNSTPQHSTSTSAPSPPEETSPSSPGSLVIDEEENTGEPQPQSSSTSHQTTNTVNKRHIPLTLPTSPRNTRTTTRVKRNT